MLITVLGSGTGVPWRGHASPGWVIDCEAGEGAVLVDPGAGSIQRMADRGIPLERLTHILFTHLHPDHTGDLVPLLFALKNPRYRERPRRVQLAGPRGLRNLMRDLLRSAWGRWVDAGDKIEVVELETGSDSFAALGLFEVVAFPVAHAEGSVAYRIERRGGPAIAYTGDTDRCDGVVDAARNADLLLIECSFPEGQKHEGHLIPSEVGRMAAAAGARRVVLLHLYPECQGQDLIGPCRAFFSGPVTVAEDGMTIRL